MKRLSFLLAMDLASKFGNTYLESVTSLQMCGKYSNMARATLTLAEYTSNHIGILTITVSRGS